MSERASIVSHQAADFETIIFYDRSGKLDFMGFYLGPDTQNSRYAMNAITIRIDSEALDIKGCKTSANGSVSLLCSVDRDSNARLLRRLDFLMRGGKELSIGGAGSASLIGYTKSAEHSEQCR